MQYTETVNIWALSEAQVKKLQPGQWVSAGAKTNDNKGIFCGVKKSGTVVVAWEHNARNSGDFQDYVQTLMNFAKG